MIYFGVKAGTARRDERTEMAPKTKKTETPADAAVIAEANATPDADLPSDDETAEVAKTKKPKWEPMAQDRLTWVVEHARPAVSPCLCGCGATTKGRFFPGHDATLKAQLSATPGGEVALAAFGW